MRKLVSTVLAWTVLCSCSLPPGVYATGLPSHATAAGVSNKALSAPVLFKGDCLSGGPLSEGGCSCSSAWIEDQVLGLPGASDQELLAEAQRQLEILEGEFARLIERNPPTEILPEGPFSASQDMALRLGVGANERTRYVATPDEIDAVLDQLELLGLDANRALVERSSQLWYSGQPLESRTREAVTLTTIALAATLGAVKAVIVYYIDYKLHNEPFECLGLMKAISTGAVLGIVAVAFYGVAVAEALLGAADIAELCVVIGGVVESLFGIPEYYFTFLSCRPGAIALDWLKELLAELIWANPTIRLPSVAICTLLNSEEIRAGGLSGVRGWAENEFVPTLLDEYGLEFLLTQTVIEEHINSSGVNSSDVPRVRGSLNLQLPVGRDAVLLLTNDTVNYSARIQPNQNGSYTSRLKVFRGGADRGTVASTGFSASASSEVNWSGVLDIADVFSQAGSIQGKHTFQIEMENHSSGWTEWVTDDEGNPVQLEVEIRTNRKPSVSLDCAILLPITKCDVFLVDPDGVRPATAVLTIDGIDQDLTSELPTSGVDWAEGYTLMRNLGLAEGVHTARARVSDSQFTSYSGSTREIRVASLPYPEFPGVLLSQVGIAHTYSARFRDSLGGISGAEISVYSNRDGTIADLAGKLRHSFVTNGTGWIYFDYTPLETGQHSLTISVDQYELSQTSNNVSPGCEPPSPPWLLDPTNGESNVPLSPTLSWRTADDTSSYDLYLGTQVPLNLVDSFAYQADDIEVAVGPLEAGKEYLWQVFGHGACDATQLAESTMRRFYTLGAPEAVTLIGPPDDSVDQPTSLVLDWLNVSTPGSFRYRLFFGDTSPPVLYEDRGTVTQKLFADVEELTPSTEYFWRVEVYSAVDPGLKNTSPEWSFTTGSTSATTETISATRDATIRAGAFANTNYGGVFGSGAGEDRNLILGTSDGLFSTPGSEISRGLVYFDLNSIPSGSNIVNATLKLENGGRDGGSPGTSLAFPIDPISSPWIESTVTWNSISSSIDTSHRVDGLVPQSGWGTLQNDVTALVTKWMDGLISNHGVQISIPAYEGVNGKAFYWSQRESDASQTWAPKLIVTYQEPCGVSAGPSLLTPAQGASNQGKSLVLHWNPVVDASAYRVFFGTATDPPEVGLVSDTELKVEDLDRGSTYYWRVEALAQCSASVVESSSIWSFQTATCLAPDAPTLTTPVDGALDQPAEVSLSWTVSAGTGDYDVYASTSNPPPTLVASTDGQSTVATVEAERTYFWKVVARADCSGALTEESSIGTFQTGVSPVADAGVDRSVPLGLSTQLGGTPTASGGLAPYTYAWTVAEGVPGSFDDSSSPGPSFEPLAMGVSRCQVEVTDSRAFSTVSLVDVTITLPLGAIFLDGFESGDLSAWDSTLGSLASGDTAP